MDLKTLTEEQRYILEKENQHFIELNGVAAVSPYLSEDSASRIQMMTNNMGQRLVLENATERFQQTGVEMDHAQYTFQIKAPCDMTVLYIENRYRRQMGEGQIRRNPETVVIYESNETGEIDMLTLVEHRSLHTTFGFKYVRCKAFDRLMSGERHFRAGEVFLQSQGISENGTLMMGREEPTVAMTLAATGEDGIIATQEGLSRFTYRTIIRRACGFGPDLIPLNTYGDDNTYLICPEQGQHVREDGLLIGFRPWREDASPYDHSVHGLQEFQVNYDRGIWVRHGGLVTDLKVIHDPNARRPRCLFGTDTQLLKYSAATTDYYDRLRKIYFQLERTHGGRLKLSNRLTDLFVRSLYYMHVDKNGARIQAEMKKAKLDDWYVEFVIETLHEPDIGSKFTGPSGNKGVIVKKIPESEAPVDDFGNRATFIVSTEAYINRQIMGAGYASKINAVYRDVCVRIRQACGLKDGELSVSYLDAKLSDRQLEEQWAKLVEFKMIYSPHYVGPAYAAVLDRQKRLKELAQILSGDRVMWMPPDNDVRPMQMVKEFNKKCPNFISPLTYVDATGVKRRTVEPILIGHDYMMLLDKTGDDWAAVNSPRLQHHGLPARIGNSNKYASLVRLQPSRLFGEAEGRNLASNTPPAAVAELADRSNNRETTELLVWGILNHPTPSNIDRLIDREVYRFNRSRPNQIVSHTAEIGGWKFAYAPYDPKRKANGRPL